MLVADSVAENQRFALRHVQLPRDMSVPSESGCATTSRNRLDGREPGMAPRSMEPGQLLLSQRHHLSTPKSNSSPMYRPYSPGFRSLVGVSFHWLPLPTETAS
jgi:hypothetical protein